MLSFMVGRVMINWKNTVKKFKQPWEQCLVQIKIMAYLSLYFRSVVPVVFFLHVEGFSNAHKGQRILENTVHE
jgi:hypothetical protein